MSEAGACPGSASDDVDGMLPSGLDRPGQERADGRGSLARSSCHRTAATDDSARAVSIGTERPGLLRRRRLGRLQHRGRASGPGRAASSAALRCRRTACRAAHEMQLPVVCAVRGWAAGLGCQLALAADFTVAAETARFWEPFLDRGFSPDSGATWLLPRLVGVARAKEHPAARQRGHRSRGGRVGDDPPRRARRRARRAPSRARRTTSPRVPRSPWGSPSAASTGALDLAGSARRWSRRPPPWSSRHAPRTSARAWRRSATSGARLPGPVRSLFE